MALPQSMNRPAIALSVSRQPIQQTLTPMNFFRSETREPSWGVSFSIPPSSTARSYIFVTKITGKIKFPN